MIDPDYELPCVVRTFEPDGFVFDPELSYCLFDLVDGVELDY